MSWIRNHVVPLGMNFLMSGKHYTEQRKIALAAVEGDVLEIGFGTGLNLPVYSDKVRRLTVIDPNPGMERVARKRMAQLPIDVEYQEVGCGQLTFSDDSFDSVVSTWTLCSIPDLSTALEQVRRVLKPSGRFHFVEHGLSPDGGVARWQRRLNGFQKWFGDGCQLTVPVARVLEEGGFLLEKCDRFYQRGALRIHGYTYRGMARKRG